MEVCKALYGGTNAYNSFLSLHVYTIGLFARFLVLLYVHNFSMNHPFDPSQNGLWRVATDGSGLARLTTEASGTTTSLSPFSQNPWSNVSRDGSMYAFQTMTNGYPAAFELAFGQCKGGVPQTLASISGTRLDLIGWTTM